MVEYRLTKYDPALRDATGAYQGDDWTAISDIGRSYNGRVLTEAEYLRVEQAHIDVALAFLREAGVAYLKVQNLENHANRALSFADGDRLQLDQLGVVIRHVLREECWCNLDGEDALLHFGYDYYIYLGVPRRCPEAEKLAASLGLFADLYEPDPGS